MVHHTLPFLRMLLLLLGFRQQTAVAYLGPEATQAVVIETYTYTSQAAVRSSRDASANNHHQQQEAIDGVQGSPSTSTTTLTSNNPNRVPFTTRLTRPSTNAHDVAFSSSTKHRGGVLSRGRSRGCLRQLLVGKSMVRRGILSFCAGIVCAAVIPKVCLKFSLFASFLLWDYLSKQASEETAERQKQKSIVAVQWNTKDVEATDTSDSLLLPPSACSPAPMYEPS